MLSMPACCNNKSIYLGKSPSCLYIYSNKVLHTKSYGANWFVKGQRGKCDKSSSDWRLLVLCKLNYGLWVCLDVANRAGILFHSQWINLLTSIRVSLTAPLPAILDSCLPPNSHLAPQIRMTALVK